jgi:hypothetical protein
MSREGSMPVLWGAVGCAAALVLLAGHGLAQPKATSAVSRSSNQVPMCSP